MSQSQVSLGQMCAHLGKLFGPRNAIYLPGIQNRISFLSMGARNLEDAIRKELGNGERGKTLASLFARICALVEHFRTISLSITMSRKYPRAGCAYCQRLPCRCLDSNRPDHQLSLGNNEQLAWSIREWQEHHELVYGSHNRQPENGIHNALHRLFAEIAELETLCLITANSESGYDQANLRQLYTLELADVFAWVMAIANLLHINLEETVISLYGLPGAPCRKCGQLPCSEGPPNMSQRRLILSTDSTVVIK